MGSFSLSKVVSNLLISYIIEHRRVGHLGSSILPSMIDDVIIRAHIVKQSSIIFKLLVVFRTACLGLARIAIRVLKVFGVFGSVKSAY